MDIKMEYEAPTLVEVGSFEEITQGAACPGNNDVPLGAPIPAGPATCFS